MIREMVQIMFSRSLSPFLCIGLMGCATATPAERDALIVASIDCTEPEVSIETLTDARPSSAERARSLLQTLTPVGLVTGMVSGQADDRAKVALGSTNREIDQKIQAIEESCRTKDETGPLTGSNAGN